MYQINVSFILHRCFEPLLHIGNGFSFLLTCKCSELSFFSRWFSSKDLLSGSFLYVLCHQNWDIFPRQWIHSDRKQDDIKQLIYFLLSLTLWETRETFRFAIQLPCLMFSLRKTFGKWCLIFFCWFPNALKIDSWFFLSQ